MEKVVFSMMRDETSEASQGSLVLDEWEVREVDARTSVSALSMWMHSDMQLKGVGGVGIPMEGR